MKLTVTSSTPPTPSIDRRHIPKEQGLYTDKHGDLWCVNDSGSVVFVMNPRTDRLYSRETVQEIVTRTHAYGPFTPFIGAIAITSTNA